MITLSDIIDNYNIDDNTLLKMDCQGCEYDVILNDYEYIKAFKEVIFEYHADIAKIPVKLLLKKLSKDFECEIVNDEDFYRRHGYSKKLFGLVKCVKR